MSLRASEAVIYGRYGFGMAGEYTEAAIDPARARPVSGAATGGTFRLLPPDEIHDTVRPIYDHAAHRRPGMRQPSRLVVAALPRRRRAGHEAVVRGRPRRQPRHARRVCALRRGVERGRDAGRARARSTTSSASSDAVELALWAYILDIDLVRTWKADERPLDDIVRAAVADRRAYSTKSVDDEQWIRVVDVDAALSARTYNDANGSVSIAVTDQQVAANNGDVGESTPAVRRTNARLDARPARRHQHAVGRLSGRHRLAHARRGRRRRRAQRQGDRHRRQPLRQPPAPVQRQLLLAPRSRAASPSPGCTTPSSYAAITAWTR